MEVIMHNIKDETCPKCEGLSLEVSCPKCGGELEYDNGSNMENETWSCVDCRTFFDVQIEVVRDWSTLEEI